MLYLIRLNRFKDIERWEVRFSNKDSISCYLSIIFLDNEQNKIAVNIHSNSDLKRTIDYDGFITTVESLFENMHLNVEHSINLDIHQVTTVNLVIRDEEEYGSRIVQITSYIDEVISNRCLNAIQALSHINITETANKDNFCQD